MILKLALLMWFVAIAAMFLTRAAGRIWIIRLLVGGFCLLLLAFFVALMRRAI